MKKIMKTLLSQRIFNVPVQSMPVSCTLAGTLVIAAVAGFTAPSTQIWAQDGAEDGQEQREEGQERGNRERGRNDRRRWQDMDEEERQKMREQWQERMAERERQMDQYIQETLGMDAETYEEVKALSEEVDRLEQEKQWALRGGEERRWGRGDWGRGGQQNDDTGEEDERSFEAEMLKDQVVALKAELAKVKPAELDADGNEVSPAVELDEDLVAAIIQDFDKAYEAMDAAILEARLRRDEAMTPVQRARAIAEGWASDD